MHHQIKATPNATEEQLAILGGLREAIDNNAARFKLLIDLRASFRPHREWKSEQQYLIERKRSPLLSKLLESLEASGISLRDALSVPARFLMNTR